MFSVSNIPDNSIQNSKEQFTFQNWNQSALTTITLQLLCFLQHYSFQRVDLGITQSNFSYLCTAFEKRQSNTDHPMVWFTLVQSGYSQFNLLAIYTDLYMLQITQKSCTEFRLLSQSCVNEHSLVKPSLLCRNSTIPCTNCSFPGFSIYHYSHTTFIGRFFCKETKRFYNIFVFSMYLIVKRYSQFALESTTVYFKLLWFLLKLDQFLVTNLSYLPTDAVTDQNR